jgi:hypothetical protein
VARLARHWYLALGALCAVVAAAVAGSVVLVFGTTTSAAAPSKSEYFSRVAAICRTYGPKLDRIPPPVDISIPAEITAAALKVQPVLTAEADAVRRLAPPAELKTKLARWTKLNDRSIGKLGEALRAGKQQNLMGIQVAYVAFIVTGAKAQHLGHEIGFPSPPC